MLHLRRLPGILYQRRYVTATLIILILTVIYYLIHWGIMCTNLETWQHVSHLVSIAFFILTYSVFQILI